VLDDIPIKTEAGRAEIKARALPLSRAARNLLLVIDGSKTARDWLGLVHGVTEDDFNELIRHGLLVAKNQPAPTLMPAAATPDPHLLAAGWAKPAAPAPAPAAATPTPTAPGWPTLERAELYAYLSGQATKLLGTFKGYTFALEVERCDSLMELQLLALQLVERVQKAKGDELAQEVRTALGIKSA
jgi:hypothetical protein